MGAVSQWLHEMAPWRAAGGVLILVGLSFFSFGAATNHLMSQVRDVPGRVGNLEAEANERDSVSAVWRANSEAEMSDWMEVWAIWSRADSIFKWETRCINRMQIENREVGRYDCKPETGEDQ